MFNRDKEEVKEEVALNQETQPEAAAQEAPEQAETPGTENGEPTAGNTAGEAKQDAAAEETLEDVQAKLMATAALLKTKEDEAAETKNRLLRLQADFDNFRRRNAAEREELATYVTISVVNKFLQILDNFERAEAAAAKAVDVQSVVDGMAGIQKQFVKTLEDLGVKEIPAQGEKFNPNFHEAVMRGQNPDMEEDTIDMVFEKGYQLHDKVVRHSKVRVISNE
ncbi:MAG: nucleotide exchange factor GrpE [Acidaminococcaceae bacterium]|nr:nucleotide exchange factor GrpE [Acidaminococcaceae bacterium]